jgi:hypothetical protein
VALVGGTLFGLKRREGKKRGKRNNRISFAIYFKKTKISE